jgi:hypothetical protein
MMFLSLETFLEGLKKVTFLVLFGTCSDPSRRNAAQEVLSGASMGLSGRGKLDEVGLLEPKLRVSAVFVSSSARREQE